MPANQRLQPTAPDAIHEAPRPKPPRHTRVGIGSHTMNVRRRQTTSTLAALAD